MVYYDLAKKQYYVDSCSNHKRLVGEGTDLHLLLVFLGQFDSRRTAEAFAEQRRQDDNKLDIG